MIRLALVGCGEHSRESHAAPLAHYAASQPGEIELVAACDLNAERAAAFCREFGFARAFTDVDKMLAEVGPDACVSVMPVELIVETSVRLLERGMPCVIEKPLGTSAAEVERLARVARETATPHMVSVNRRFMPYLNRALAWAREIGPLQYVRAAQVRHNRDEADFIWTTAIHALDALRHVAGEVKIFDAEVQRGASLSTTWYVVSLHFEGGARGQIEVLPTAGMVEESYELFGEGYRARVVAGSGAQRSLECWRGGRLEVEAVAADDEPAHLRNGSYEEVVEFVQALKAGTRPRPTVEDILPSAYICLSIAEEVTRQTRTL
ncbi:MAG TPA: Gfo/Idh/MocA family oxidoreductase [Pyrinomonadaceae bacterium]|nr:Gfo/Idh/MocA family oxidoreductase [Pyrinomonadaceae bacterium]